MKKILFLLISVLGVMQAQEIIFSHENSWYDQEFDLVLSSSTSEIWYTTNGKDPVPGTAYTSPFNGHIPIVSLRDTAYQLLDRAEDFTSDASIYHGGTSFYSQNSLNEFDFLNIPPYEDVPKKQIIKACTGDCEEIFTRSYGIGEYPNSKWEIELVFDDVDLVFDKDSGQYARGVGVTVPWFLSPTLYGNNQYGVDLSGQPDSVNPENYEARERLRMLTLPTVFNPDGFDEIHIPDHWDYTQATVLLYYNNQFIEQAKAEVRPNGNGRIHRPLKGWKIKLKKDLTADIPFAETRNFVLRTEGRNDGAIQARLSSEIANMWTFGPYISRKTDITALSVYNGSFLESFGVYGIFSANDKRYARKYWKMNDPEQLPWTSSTDGAQAIFELANPEMTPEWYYLLRDTTWVLAQDRATLSEYINMEAWIKYAAHKCFFRPASSWHREQKVYEDKDTPRSTPVVKDEDSNFDFENLGWNHIATFITRSDAYGADVELTEDIDLMPSWALWAALMHPERQHYYQNLMLDGFESFARYSKTKPVLDSVVADFWSYYPYYSEIEKINNTMDSMGHIYNQENIDLFLQQVPAVYLEDWIEFFHPGYSLEDTFNVRIALDQEIDQCGIYPGKVRVNSMEFISDGSRIHVRDYPLEIEAIPSPGYVFSHWEQNAEEQLFMLTHETTENVFLTPVFVKEYSACDNREELIINEVLPWHAELPDLIEIYNPTDQDIILDGMYISDRGNVLKHNFNEGVVKAHSFFVIQTKGSPLDSIDYYLNDFALSKNGEAVYLFDTDSTVIHYVEWGQVQYPLSYGYCDNQKIDGLIPSMEIMTFGKMNECVEDTIDTSIDFVETYNITVFPNPASSQISIKSDIQIEHVNIVNLQGSRVHSSPEQIINISHLSSGVYFVEIHTPVKKEYVKFIKK